jgi:hypothetical protein
VDLYFYSPIRLRGVVFNWGKLYLFTYLLTELSPSLEAAHYAAIQEIAGNFKKPEGSSPCSQELTEEFLSFSASPDKHRVSALQ